MTPPQAVKAQGWIWDQNFPTNLVSVNSGKRNNVFYVGQPIVFTLTGKSAVSYEVRDYGGNVVAQGVAEATITPKVTQPGWYKLYLHGSPAPATYGDSVGGTTFVIFRNKAGFPALPAPTTSGSTYNSVGDEVMRGITGMGPQRHYVQDAGQPEQAIAALEGDIALDEAYYLPFDPTRNRKLLVAFPNGTQNLEGVKKIVARFKNRVAYWEPRNEPNGGSNGTDFVNKELIPFYQTVKSASPTAKVLGPGVVSVGPGMLGWIEDFLKAGGAKYIDGFSFHAYNNINGDLSMARACLDNLNTLLAKYGADKIEKWQTEQGYFAAYYGAYSPRHQGRWTMTQMMAFEQYGIPKEHNHLWYDRSHGFWDVPAWWENDDGGLNPAGALMRVWSEELQAANFVRAFDMGATGDKQYIGSLFQGGSKEVAVFMSAGGTDGQISLNVTGGGSVHVVSAFGVEQDLPVHSEPMAQRVSGLPVKSGQLTLTGPELLVKNGQVTLPVSELPVYVEAAPGQTIEVAPIDWGPNLALQPGVKVIASGVGTNPVWPSTNNNPLNMVNDQMENWYYAQGTDGHPWMSNVSSFPATVEVDLPSKQTVSHVAIYCPVPWQFDGSLLDYDLQYDNNGQWVTIGSAKEPTNTLAAFTPALRCTVDSFYSDRNIFTHTFAPILTSKLRLYVRDATWGGGAVKAFNDAIGYNLPHQINIREIEVYGPTTAGMGSVAGQMKNLVGKPMTGVPITLSGWQNAQTKTDASGSYRFTSLESGRAYTVTPQISDPLLLPSAQTIAHLYGDQQLNFAEIKSTAQFVSMDAATQGKWSGVYGAEAYNVIGDTSKNAASILTAPAGQLSYTWAASTTAVNALQKASNPSDRLAACWYNNTSFGIDVQITDAKMHRISLYLLDWDTNVRSERIDILDGATGSVLATQTVKAYNKGVYLTWNVQGHVIARFTNLSGDNAVVSGLFFDPIGK